MFVRNAIQISAIVRDSAWVIGLSAAWSFLVVLLHDILDYDMVALPQTPVSTIGIVVSLYLGFKTTSAYNRWWEARKIWGRSSMSVGPGAIRFLFWSTMMVTRRSA